MLLSLQCVKNSASENNDQYFADGRGFAVGLGMAKQACKAKVWWGKRGERRRGRGVGS
jgi:hypothetical protein